MIGVKLMGGLGNQMFQYALGRKMSIKHSTQLALDLNGYNNQVELDTPRHYELDCFKINADLINTPLLEKKPFFSKFSKSVYFDNTYSENKFRFNEEALAQPNGTHYIGYWQTEKYFSDIRVQLLNDFRLKDDLSSEDLNILNKIKTVNSISLHVRRGDYVTNENANKFHGLKGLDYYNTAINLIKEKIDNFTVFVFSDDIEWCKENLQNIHESIEFIDGKRPGYLDMFLMKNCRHNILANSSFSWWAAWLNENPSKIIVAPKNWFDDPNTDTSDVIPDTWTKI